MKEDYLTRFLDQMVWLTLSGIQSTGTYLAGDEVFLHFPDKAECERLVGSEDFKRYQDTIREIKSIIANAKR